MGGTKRAAEEMPSPAKSSKSTHEEAGGSGDIEMSAQAGSSLPGGTGSDVVATIIRAPRAQQVQWHFKKTFQLYTGGFQFSKVNMNNFVPSALNTIMKATTQGMTTPLCVLNPDDFFWYLSENEYSTLPPFTRCLNATIKVTPLGYRLPFATNEAESSFANSQTLVQIATGIGFNTKMNMFAGNYTTDPANLTMPTGGVDPPRLQALIYGSDGNIGANTGVPRHIGNYATLVWPQTTENSTPNALTMYKIQNVNDCKGTPVINYSCEFREGWLRLPTGGVTDPTNQQISTQAGTTQIPVKNPMFGMRHFQGNTTNNNAFSIMPVNDDLTEQFWGVRYGIEKKNYTSRHLQINPDVGSEELPLVHFGVMPVQSNAALAPTPTFANVVVQWEVETSLTVELSDPYCLPVTHLAWLDYWDPACQANTASVDIRACAYYVSNRRVMSVNPSYPTDSYYPRQAPPL